MEEISKKREKNIDDTALTHELIHLLSHSRHDWMNKLQLIKGNLTLKKYDRVFEIIDEVVIEAQHESKLSNLKISRFAYDLLTFNWTAHSLTLEYEVIGEVRDLSAYDEKLVILIRKLFRIFDDCVSKESENHLTVTLQTDGPEGSLVIYLDFHGVLTELIGFEEFHKSPEDFYEIRRLDVSERECLAEIHVK
ncbi:sporulation initiation phosphotransferase B [Bacillus glycinifermentans]|uniref:sporulation initiation phosphotransferase B n=1 Tax=Bacillus glycinifermentans TaxID=1664069 RepID=UPI002DB62FCD|nr:sporulation initiation phosphotransferase B [Bacillus glycinifermentans]MEC0493137.1 sporulation initiation phosphotransferase B [Bacillus glycinifermentans]MEC0542435.1 sporulation initiation phosphotransferase B [Bacillus glycinifermentans]